MLIVMLVFSPLPGFEPWTFNSLTHLGCVWIEGLGREEMGGFTFLFKITDYKTCFSKIN